MTDKVNNNLTPELWGHALQFLFFDEIVKCTSVNKFFRNDVPEHIKLLLIRNSDSMSPNIVKRFSNVEDVYVYSLIKEIGPDHGSSHRERIQAIMREAASRGVAMSMSDAHIQACQNPVNTNHFDVSTAEKVVPFLIGIPKLETCYIGGLCSCEDENHWGLNPDDVRVDLSYSTEDKYDVENSNTIFAALLRNVCEAYVSGGLSKEVKIDGLIVDQRCQYNGNPCAWEEMKTTSHRDDVDCQLCDQICMSLPPSQVVSFTNGHIPCISTTNRLHIAKCREPSCFANAKEQLLKEMTFKAGGMRIRMPPDYQERGWATVYNEENIEKFKWLVTYGGANVRDPAIRRLLVEEPEFNEDFGEHLPTGWNDSRNIRAIEKTTLVALIDIGFDIRESDFMVVDCEVDTQMRPW